MKEEPRSFIVAACLTLNFARYIENCSMSDPKKGLVSRQPAPGSLQETLFQGQTTINSSEMHCV